MLTLIRVMLALLSTSLAEEAFRAAEARAEGPIQVPGGQRDMATCKDLSGAEATAKLLDSIPGTVFTVGDNAYPDGSPSNFKECYEPTWGRHKARTRPALGNHDHHTPHAAGYFEYFGAQAGDPGRGYYSYDLGTWHVVVIDSNCSEVGGCGVGSPQEQWLRADLAAHPARCTLAYWHHPLFSSGVEETHARHPEMRIIWQDLYDAGVELVLNGHEHNYERFAPQDPTGRADAHGIREIVVGTGGKDFNPLPRPFPNSEVRRADAFGVLKLTLRPDGYDWEFVPVAGGTFIDSGSGVCH